ncbi:MAG: glycosyltransferase [Balneolaceae bacterium]|nr:glycosyltransferase [Balneolaceae bacterium]MDR9409803.1 glycosyltransferase [Balneolaceae bacterium]
MTDAAGYIIIIRSSNERTTKICKDLVEKQALDGKVVVIRKKPFKLALEECFRTAIRQQATWLITVDADMLILPGTIEKLYKTAEQMPAHYLQLQGRILDKITGSIRKAGPRIYRVSLLEKALNISESSDNNNIRPEAHVVSEMGQSGHPSRYIPTVTCLHDYEQYYADLYRKSIVHAKKHHEFVADIISRAASKMQKDDDFKVILKAVWDGLTRNIEVSADSRLFQKRAEEALAELGLTEKNDIENVDDIIGKMKEWIRQIPADNSAEITFRDQPKPKYSILRRIKNIITKKGLIGGLSYGAGEILVDLGKRLQK